MLSVSNDLAFELIKFLTANWKSMKPAIVDELFF